MRPSQHRRKKSSTKTNVILAVVFHALIAFVATFWAAHEGVLGQKLKELTVAIVPPEKKPEPEKPPPPKIEPPKEEIKKEESPKLVETPKVEPAPATAPKAGPVGNAEPAVAPAAASPPDFTFGDGAKEVVTSTNSPALYYRNLVEYSLRSNWERPAGIIDDTYSAEVEIHVDGTGRIISHVWKKGSGDSRWDDSVKKAVAATQSLNRPPPKGFPETIVVRFDVLPVTDDLLYQ